MPAHEPIDDGVLGRLTWDESKKEWVFRAAIIDGREIPGTIVVADIRLPLQEQGLDEIRACVQWVRANEAAIRSYLTEKMFAGWLDGGYDPEVHTVTTPEGFREAISLVGVNILEDRRAFLVYNDGNLFGGHAIVTSVGADGRFDFGPDIWG